MDVPWFSFLETETTGELHVICAGDLWVREFKSYPAAVAAAVEYRFLTEPRARDVAKRRLQLPLWGKAFQIDPETLKQLGFRILISLPELGLAASERITPRDSNPSPSPPEQLPKLA